jgi:predicted TIM-barrel fold metal-dependent hydrolase
LRAIDCDVHPFVPSLKALEPHMEPYWREMIEVRGIETNESQSYPINSPLTCRPDWRREPRPASKLEDLAPQVFGQLGADMAILNSLWGVQLVMNEDQAIAFARALNNWIRVEWLDRDPRLRASIVVPTMNVEHAVEEIERCAADPRFVQVLFLCMTEQPMGRRHFWPIYEACLRHNLTVGIHAGSTYKNPVTSIGWPSWYLEDYTDQAQGFQSQLTSMICEGVFAQHPDLRVVLMESGVSWLPGFMWRLSKFWRGLRFEVPWVKQAPMEIVRKHVRLTIQPLDAPDDPALVEKLMNHFGSDEMFLYASDYPHWQFDGDDPMPPAIPPSLRQKIMVDNPLKAYPRIKELVA